MSLNKAFLLSCLLVSTQAIYEMTYESCQKATKVDGIFIADHMLRSLLENSTNDILMKRNRARDVILVDYESQSLNVSKPCPELTNYLPKIEDDLKQCALNFSHFKTAEEQITHNVISVVYNTNQKARECRGILDAFLSPINCSPFGYRRKIRKSCSQLVAKIGRLQVEMYVAQDKADCCFANKIQTAVKNIKNIADNCTNQA